MRRLTPVLLLLLPALPSAAVCQRGAPLLSLTAGAGHPFGGIGLQGEVLIADGRFGILGGVGTLPGFHNLRSPFTGTAGVRYYFGRQGHRFFADASWSLLDAYDLLMPGVPPIYDYGPGFSLGYSFLSKVGFTFTVAGGVGHTSHETLAIGQVGLGWTWRRPS